MNTLTKNKTRGGISETHMLAELNLKLPSGTARNKKLEQEAEQKHGVTDANRVRAVVDVYNTDFLKSVRKIHAGLRNMFSATTLPWSERGQRLVANEQMKMLKAEIDKCKIEASAAWKQFCDELDHHKARDKQVLGTLFDESLYPSKEELDGRHSIEIVFAAVPDAEHDVRAGWDQDTIDTYQTQVISKEKVRTTKALKVLNKRAYDMVSRVADRMAKYDGTRTGSYNDSLIPNVKDIMEMCKMFNLNDDPEMKKWTEEMAVNITRVSSQDLRDNPELRKEIGGNADRLAKKIQKSALGGFGTAPELPAD
jgi:hypothetical protein